MNCGSDVCLSPDTKEKMRAIVANVPGLPRFPLHYVMEELQLKHKENTLWLEFGVYQGTSTNYISRFTHDIIYGFDSFEGLPEKWRDGYEKGVFNRQGSMPSVSQNVRLIKGWFHDTLPDFMKGINNQKISFLHIDSDLYSSAKFVLDLVKDSLDEDCVVIFDELFNFPQYDSETCELRAFYEFITENEVDYEWIGYYTGVDNQAVALIIHSVKPKEVIPSDEVKEEVEK